MHDMHGTQRSTTSSGLPSASSGVTFTGKNAPRATDAGDSTRRSVALIALLFLALQAGLMLLALRSFVLRQGRVSNAQQRAHAALLPKFGIPYAPHTIDLDCAFGRRAPKVLEIGFGMGETTAILAAQHPQYDYLGIEVHTPGVGSLLKRIAELDLANVRIVQHDAVEVNHLVEALGLLDSVVPGGRFTDKDLEVRLRHADYLAHLVHQIGFAVHPA